jgi:hypothetical protein
MKQITFIIKNLDQTNHKQFYYVHSSLFGGGSGVTGPILHGWYFKIMNNNKHHWEVGIGRMVDSFR